MKFKSKKDRKDSIVIHAKHYNKEKGVYFFIKKMNAEETLPDNISYDSRLIRDFVNHYYLCIPLPRRHNTCFDDQETTIKKNNGKMAALDPGVRTFQVIFDTEGFGIEFGKGDIRRIYRLYVSL